MDSWAGKHPPLSRRITIAPRTVAYHLSRLRVSFPTPMVRNKFDSALQLMFTFTVQCADYVYDEILVEVAL